MINDFLTRMAAITRDEANAMRDAPDRDEGGPSEFAAQIGGLDRARLVFKSGANELLLRGSSDFEDLYRAKFHGHVPQVRLRDGVVEDWAPGAGWHAERRPSDPFADLRARLTELWDYERFELPVQEGGRVFFRRNDGLQNQSALYVLEPGSAAPRLLLDPNALSKDGTVALMSFVPSGDGALVAYSLSDGGSDWRTWRVRRVGDGVDLSDTLTRNKFGALAWAADGSGFFYARYDAPPPGTALQAKNAPPDVCFHRLGTAEEADVLIARRPAEPGRSQGFRLSEDGTVLFQSVQDANTNNEASDSSEYEEIKDELARLKASEAA